MDCKTAMRTFFLAMARHPDIQLKAQAEIDSVLGHARLPSFDDRPSLPYITAIAKEVLRWHPVVPMSVPISARFRGVMNMLTSFCRINPHLSTEDETYASYFLPSGTCLMANTWYIAP
jgi:hypothetical protein